MFCEHYKQQYGKILLRQVPRFDCDWLLRPCVMGITAMLVSMAPYDSNPTQKKIKILIQSNSYGNTFSK